MASSSKPSMPSSSKGIDLSKLPSTGLLEVGASVRFGPAPAVYVAMKKDTVSPVEVTTDPSSLLIRCLQKKSAVPSGAAASSKQPASTNLHAEKEKNIMDERGADKKRKGHDEPCEAGDGGSETSHKAQKTARDIQRTVYSEEALLQMSVAKLKGILAEKGLKVSGKKVVLVERILAAQ